MKLTTINSNGCSVALVTDDVASTLYINLGQVLDLWPSPRYATPANPPNNTAVTTPLTVDRFMATVRYPDMINHGLLLWAPPDIAGVYLDVHVVVTVLMPWLRDMYAAFGVGVGVQLAFLSTHMLPGTTSQAVGLRHSAVAWRLWMRTMKDQLLDATAGAIRTVMSVGNPAAYSHGTTGSRRIRPQDVVMALSSMFVTWLGRSGAPPTTPVTAVEPDTAVADSTQLGRAVGGCADLQRMPEPNMIRYVLATMVTRVAGVPLDDTTLDFTLAFTHSIVSSMKRRHNLARLRTTTTWVPPPLPPLAIDDMVVRVAGSIGLVELGALTLG